MAVTKENLGVMLNFYPCTYKERYNVELNDGTNGRVFVLRDPTFRTIEGTIEAAREFLRQHRMGRFQFKGWKQISNFKYGEA